MFAASAAGAVVDAADNEPLSSGAVTITGDDCC